MKALYVEGNAQDVDLVQRALARLMPEVALEVVPTLKAATERLAQNSALDLVLSDLLLPDGTGLELLAHIRMQKLPLAVVILTGFGDQDSAIAALKSGADDYLTKHDNYLTRLPQTLTRALARFHAASARKVKPILVLYAEHNTFDVDLTRRHLAQHSPHILLDVVSNAEEALSLLPLNATEPSTYDVALLDYRLQGLDALEVVKVLREERGLKLPIVLITGQGNEEIAAQALHLGVDDYLTKHTGYLFELPSTLEKVQRQAELERKQIALQESKRRYDELTARIPAGVYRFRIARDGSQQLDYVSPRFCEMNNLEMPKVLADINTAFARVHHDDLPGLLHAIDEAWRTVAPFSWEGRANHPGETRWVHIESSPTVLDNGDIIWDGVQLDITERKQTQQIQQTRNEVLDQIISNQPLPAILEHIARQLELVHSEMHISILLLDAKAQRLTIGAAPSLPAFFNVAVEGLKMAPSNGSCGTAAYLGETVIVEDIATHPYWAPYREVAARAGLGACWSVPFKDAAGLVLGTFAIYYNTPRTPTPIDLELIAEFSRITGLAVQKSHAETLRLEAERRFRATFEQSTMLMGIVAQNGLLMVVNPAALTVIGAQESDVIDQPFWDTPWWRDNPPQQERLKQALASAISGKIDSFEATHLKADGSMVTVECRASPILIGCETQVLVIGFDISERKRTEEVLRQFATVFSSIHDGVMITDFNASILSVNPAFTEITGYTEAEVKGGNPHLLQSGRQDRSFYQTMWANLTETGHWQGEIWNRRKNGEIYPEWMTISSVYDAFGKTDRYVAVFSDISKIKQSEERLEHLAHYDALTQLPNRLLLFSRIEHSLEIAQRENKLLALLMLDLDHFKDVNDSFGHLAGDELLQQVAERLTSRLRGIDTVCRLGGDEFTVLLEEIAQPEDAARLANVIIDALSEPWRLSNGSEVRISASVGISLFPEHANTAEELLRQADAALYQAKLEGRSRFKYFSEELTRAVRARITLEARLRQAIDNDELRVFYQPQVEIVSGRIIGAEALVRWQHPTDGLLMPGYFIPVAEETGLITPIGNWVLKETCRQGQRWIEAGLPPLALAVNLSPHQFLHSDIQQVVATALAETGFPATCLELELTESALMERETEAIQILNRLRELGVRLAIDDFGTGYSSLAYLKHFPLDVLKIDKSFIDDIPNEPNDMAITATIIAMAHTLGLKVLAEGVETKAQLDFLRAQGCDYYQGYLTSPPVSAEVFEKLQVAQN